MKVKKRTGLNKKKTGNQAKNGVKEKGITLIALVVTIIVLLILAGVTITAVLGGDGIIAKAQLAAFITEMQEIKQNVDMKKVQDLTSVLVDGTSTELFSNKFNVNSEDDYKIPDTLKKEILYVRDKMPGDKVPDDYDVETFNELVDVEGNVEGIYVLDKQTGNGKENTYIYDETTDTVFKIPQTKIGGKVYHSYECAIHEKGGTGGAEEAGGSNSSVQEEPIVSSVDNLYYYAPNLKGFSETKTYVVYYSADFSKTEEVLAKDYIAGGQQRQITGKDGGTYTLHNYGKSKIWANIKTEGIDEAGDKLEAWWVWIPRYAYKVNGSKADIIYVGLDNKTLEPEGKDLEEGYEVHPAFTEGGNLKGIWMSKYEASYKYLATSDKGVLAPNMEGFDPEKTYIELYDSIAQTFTEVPLKGANLNTINNENKWYDYSSKIWANIKTEGTDEAGNKLEAWWVWIPRYAYRIAPNTPSGDKMEIIYVDETNKPLDSKYGTKLPKGFIVHPAFTEGGNLRGIWMSKYEANCKYLATSDKGVLAPDMEGFDPEKTYIELYDSITQTFTEVPLKGANLNTINNENKWYDYSSKIWANIKTEGTDEAGNKLEAWWVWIPRYAYRIAPNTPSGDKMEIIYVDETNKPLDSKYGTELPKGFIVHPAFTAGDNLKGIWMSKYEASTK